MASAMREVWKAKDMGAMRDISMWTRSGYCVMSWYGTTLEGVGIEAGILLHPELQKGSLWTG